MDRAAALKRAQQVVDSLAIRPLDGTRFAEDTDKLYRLWTDEKVPICIVVVSLSTP